MGLYHPNKGLLSHMSQTVKCSCFMYLLCFIARWTYSNIEVVYLYCSMELTASSFPRSYTEAVLPFWESCSILNELWKVQANGNGNDIDLFVHLLSFNTSAESSNSNNLTVEQRLALRLICNGSFHVKAADLKLLEKYKRSYGFTPGQKTPSAKVSCFSNQRFRSRSSARVRQ